MRTLIYTRVSTEDQDERLTHESQEREARDYCKQHGLQVIRVAHEQQTGGEFWERAILSAERERIRNGEYDIILVHSVDRLSRDIAHLFIIYDECRRAGVQLRFVTANFEDTPEGKLMFALNGYYAESERIKIRERMTRGKRQRVERGKLINASTPLYGYSQDKTTSARTIKPDEAKIIRRIYDLALAGIGMRSIAQRLNAEGIPSPADGKRTYKNARLPQWGKSTIARILREPAYAGLSVAMRWQHVRKNGKAEVIERPRSEWIMLDSALTPAIISQAEFDAVQLCLSLKRGDTRRNESHPVLLRGLIVCLRCGRRRVPDVPGYGYRCSSRYTAAGSCGSGSTPMQAIEKWVWSEIQRLISDPAQIEQHIRDAAQSHLSDRDSIENALRLTQQKITKCENNLRQLLTRFGDDDSLADFVEDQIRHVGQQLKALQTERDSLLAQLATADADQLQLDEIAAFAARMASQAELSFAQKREILELFRVSVSTDADADWRLHIGATLAEHSGHNIRMLWAEYLLAD